MKQDNAPATDTVDPDPLAILIILFGSGLSVLANLTTVVSAGMGMSQARQETAKDERFTVAHMLRADRELTRMIKRVQRIHSILREGGVLHWKVWPAPGKFKVTVETKDELNRLVQEVGVIRPELEAALDELAGQLTNEEMEGNQSLAGALDDCFSAAKRAQTLDVYMQQIARLLDNTAGYIERVAAHHKLPSHAFQESRKLLDATSELDLGFVSAEDVGRKTHSSQDVAET